MTEYKVMIYDTHTEWYNLDEVLHREENNGPAIEWADGAKYWYINGELHREDGPASEYANGDKHWYINGQLHRTDGPAIECVNGFKSWWINGVHYSEQEFNEYINKQNKPCLGKKIIVDGVEYDLR